MNTYNVPSRPIHVHAATVVSAENRIQFVNNVHFFLIAFQNILIHQVTETVLYMSKCLISVSII